MKIIISNMIRNASYFSEQFPSSEVSVIGEKCDELDYRNVMNKISDLLRDNGIIADVILEKGE